MPIFSKHKVYGFWLVTQNENIHKYLKFYKAPSTVNNGFIKKTNKMLNMYKIHKI